MRSWFPVLVFVMVTAAHAQSSQDDLSADSLGTTILLDDPGALHRLQLGIQPLYGESSGTGSHAGYGLDILYRVQRRLDLRFQFRKPWSAQLYDQSRDDARRNSNTTNSLVSLSYVEAGMAFHLVDRRTIDTLDIPLKERGLQGQTWDNPSRQIALVPATRRTLTSLRLGTSFRRSVVDVSDALRKQGKLNANVLLPESFTDMDGLTRPFRIFSSARNTFFYAGVSRSVIRNFSVGFDHYAVASRDASLTLFVDLLIGTGSRIENALYNGLEFPLDALQYHTAGMRVGLDLIFDRDLGYAIGWEAGIRPGMAGLGKYTQIKISFPVFGRYLGQRRLLHRQGTAQL